MKLRKVEKAAEIRLAGVDVEVVLKDRSLNRVILKDKEGNYVEFAAESYSFTASVPAPKEKKSVWEISGSFEGIQVKEQHEDEHEAIRRFNLLEGRDGVKDLRKEEIEIEVE